MEDEYNILFEITETDEEETEKIVNELWDLFKKQFLSN